MMNVWDFLVESPSDLPVFADLLDEWGHPGAATVRWLVKHRRFPRREKRLWFWSMAYLPAGEKIADHPACHLPLHFLADGSLPASFSATEAAWKVVNARLYKPRRKRKVRATK